MKNIYVLVVTVLFVVMVFSLVFAQETLTISTYYPSPYGSYNELQLVPHTPNVTVCNAAGEGTMYYDSAANDLRVCAEQAVGVYGLRPLTVRPFVSDTQTTPATHVLNNVSNSLTDIRTPSLAVQNGDVVMVLLSGVVHADTALETGYMQAYLVAGGAATTLITPNFITSTSSTPQAWGGGTSVGIYRATANGNLVFGAVGYVTAGTGDYFSSNIVAWVIGR
ncbi:MAG: hypothetical protein NTZ92_03690 [Candidatus Omnitrophica bacterium]|nr:hypothetical protein [Candidatus Omnitrophota bacterium]